MAKKYNKIGKVHKKQEKNKVGAVIAHIKRQKETWIIHAGKESIRCSTN